jgi:hypothetical protein
MARTHRIAPIVIELAREEGLSIAMGSPPRLSLFREPALDTIPGLSIDDRLVQAVVGLPFVAKPSLSRSPRAAA